MYNSIIMRFVLVLLMLSQCIDGPSRMEYSIIGNKIILRNSNGIPKLNETTTIIEAKYNFISELMPSTFSHGKFTHIDLKNNKIRDVHKNTFANQTKLKMLDLSGNGIRYFNDSLKNNSKLQKLYLHDNPHLYFLSLDLPENLQKLNMTNTSFNMTMDDLNKFKKLKYQGPLYTDRCTCNCICTEDKQEKSKTTKEMNNSAQELPKVASDLEDKVRFTWDWVHSLLTITIILETIVFSFIYFYSNSRHYQPAPQT
ncbi:hypothetical protein ILUMI_00517 [Ignelater luminosus]|uniref:Uncharacterized protein n=1 Tax=Ignelater luminosus TaxID=2038154 RepID=A0A8K0DSH8_IGNLU|nr:hypothetical protein ILUMI_00517 [Ignelater luminosus]